MNPNTGILLLAGVGSVHHRVHFENTENPITQLDQPYLSGYDRLTWGVAVKEFVGYWHMSDNGLINWFGGLEFWQARTWPQRPMNFDTQEVEEGPRNDRFVSLQVGWVFHITSGLHPSNIGTDGRLLARIVMRLYRAGIGRRRHSAQARGWLAMKGRLEALGVATSRLNRGSSGCGFTVPLSVNTSKPDR